MTDHPEVARLRAALLTAEMLMYEVLHADPDDPNANQLRVELVALGLIDGKVDTG